MFPSEWKEEATAFSDTLIQTPVLSSFQVSGHRILLSNLVPSYHVAW